MKECDAFLTECINKEYGYTNEKTNNDDIEEEKEDQHECTDENKKKKLKT